MNFSLFIFGFFFGFLHALEADHMAAVSVIVAKSVSAKNAAAQGMRWAMGHTVMVLLLGAACAIFGWQAPISIGPIFEKIAAAVLVLLGVFALRDFWKSRQYVDGGIFHDHPPAGPHYHAHASFAMGMLHGLAGSAAVLVIAWSVAARSPLAGFLWLLFFGAGSAVGMGSFSWAMSVGLAHARGHTAFRFIQKYASLATGVFSFSVGIFLFTQFL